MKAIICDSYNYPENIQIKEIPKPEPGNNDVLVKVVATAINDYDWSLVRGRPYIYRTFFGLRKPRNPIPGMELSGIIEDIGKDVTRFKVGDAVMADTSDYQLGTFAEYIVLNQNALTLKPNSISFEDAASLPHASLLAWQSLRNIAQLEDGQTILINGGGGGVGLYGVQIAKWQNCTVTGVDTGEKLEVMKRMGYDEVIDYKKQDFTAINKKYDVILDCKTNRNPWRYLRSLNNHGVYVTVGGSVGKLITTLLFTPISRKLSGKTVRILALKPNQGLDHILNAFQNGRLENIVDGPYAFEKIPECLEYFGKAQHSGKVIISVSLNDYATDVETAN